jgi:lipoyl(octanoyl) transferase
MIAHPTVGADVGQCVDWLVTPGLVSYQHAVAFMSDRVDAIAEGRAPELVWLLEHPPLYTAGTSARAAELIDPNRFPVHTTGRGGRYTYHGPGQRVGYVMLNLNRRGRDVRAYVAGLEGWIIDTLAALGLSAIARPGKVGVWIHSPAGPQKIAAIGVRLRRWVSSHGFSLNVAPDLDHFSGIVPCGISDEGVTSLAQLGVSAGLEDVDNLLKSTFQRRFGAVSSAKRPPFLAQPSFKVGPA